MPRLQANRRKTWNSPQPGQPPPRSEYVELSPSSARPLGAGDADDAAHAGTVAGTCRQPTRMGRRRCRRAVHPGDGGAARQSARRRATLLQPLAADIERSCYFPATQARVMLADVQLRQGRLDDAAGRWRPGWPPHWPAAMSAARCSPAGRCCSAWPRLSGVRAFRRPPSGCWPTWCIGWRAAWAAR